MSIPVALQPQYATGNSTLCSCLQVTRQDGVVVRITSIDRPVDIVATTESGVVLDGIYSPIVGLSVQSLVSSASLAVDNTEFGVLPDDALNLSVDIQTGLWDRATFVLFECNYLDTSQGVRVLKRGTTGDVKLNRGMHTIEFRGLSQALQQTITVLLSRTCRNRFGVNDGVRSRCPVNLADYTESALVTLDTSRLVFTTNTAMPDDWSAMGQVRFLTGANTGYRRKVKSLASGVITLTEALPFMPEVGDELEHIAGCRLRFAEDCRDKFHVALSFNGEPNLTGIDQLTTPVSGEA